MSNKDGRLQVKNMYVYSIFQLEGRIIIYQTSRPASRGWRWTTRSHSYMARGGLVGAEAQIGRGWALPPLPLGRPRQHTHMLSLSLTLSHTHSHTHTHTRKHAHILTRMLTFDNVAHSGKEIGFRHLGHLSIHIPEALGQSCCGCGAASRLTYHCACVRKSDPAPLP